MLVAVEGRIYPYISMGTTMSIMLLFTWSSRIRSVNVGSHTIVFKSLSFGLFTLKQPQSFLTKVGSTVFSKVSVFNLEKVNDRHNRNKSYAF